MSRISTYLKKQNFWWWITNILLAFIIVLILFPSLRQSFFSLFYIYTVKTPDTEQPHQPIHASVYEWKVTNILTNEDVKIEDIARKTIFINIWATWCSPCIQEMPMIQNLYKKTKNDVIFLIVSTESPNKIKKFLESKDWDLPIYYTKGFPRALNIKSYPTTLIINQNEIILKEEGAAQWDGEKMIDFIKGLN